MIEQQLTLKTAAGQMSTFICHPERGTHPVVIFYMDAPGIREELRDMCRRLASVGYYVMLPNLYYRSNVEELGQYIGPEFIHVRQRVMQLKDSINIGMVMQDTDALVAHANADAVGADAAASKGPMGSVGYCMSGQYAISAAARYPDRFKAAASIYGVTLTTDRPDSAHLAARRATAEIYVAFAENDNYVPLETVAPLRESLREGGVNAEVEIYPGVEHGFAFPQRPIYNRAAAERHWERLFALFRRNLDPIT
jgi:carboxymethylenebutenolidase